MPTSSRLSAIGLPTLRVSNWASSSPCSSTWTANLRSRRARSAGATDRQAGPASSERATAASASSTPWRGISAMGASVAGFTIVMFMHAFPGDRRPRCRRARGERGTDQGLEEPGVAGLLGMPLHADDEAAAGQLHGLDHPVVAHGRHHQAAAQPGETLVVAAQDLDPLAQHPTHDAPLLGLDHHPAECTRSGLVAGRAEEVGQLLDEVPPEADVEHLCAAADGQHRQVAPERILQHGDLEIVPLVAGAAVAGVGVLPVADGADVSTADQHQAVQGRHHFRQSGALGAGLPRRWGRRGSGPWWGPGCGPAG